MFHQHTKNEFYIFNFLNLKMSVESQTINFLKKYFIEIKHTVIEDGCSLEILKVVKFLHSIGAECTKDAVEFASENGHLEVVTFLQSIM